MIPLLDLQAQFRSLQPELERAVMNVLASGQYILGREVKAFEEEFANYCGARHAVAVNSGTSALHLALLAAGIGPGDEVITTPMTFVATASAIVSAGATPVFVDIDPVTLTLDAKRVEEAITLKTRAIVPVHLYGQMADMEPLLSISRRHDLPIIEDACQAHGADYLGQRAGSMGLAGAFSFYPGKNLGACGEGGAVVTNDEEVANHMRRLRDWGQTERYHHVELGFNYRMDAVQGAILRVKLRHLEDWTTARRDIARIYDAQLSGIPDLVTPREMPGRRHVYHVYAVRSPDRRALADALAQEDIHTGLHYPIPVHLQPAYAFLGHKRGDFPETEAAAREVLSLPIFPELGMERATQVANAVRQGVLVDA